MELSCRLPPFYIAPKLNLLFGINMKKHKPLAINTETLRRLLVLPNEHLRHVAGASGETGTHQVETGCTSKSR
jgi:hypothetical protein